MLTNKPVKVITGIIILGIIFISILPDIVLNVKKGTSEIKKEYETKIFKIANNYIVDNKDKLYLYEGATYCITSNTLKHQGYIKEDLNFIVEAKYKNNEFLYKINNNCKEK